MKKLTLDFEALGVETLATEPELGQAEAGFMMEAPSRRSCIEQCTTSCTF